MRRTLAVVVALCVVPAAFAGGLKKYKDWSNSPQGYFMTSAERAEWKANVKSDEEAEAFVNKFVASRGAGFVDDVKQRADVADKHLTVSGRAGSRTTRGKIVILLGPPSSFAITTREIAGSDRTNPPAAASGAPAGPGSDAVNAAYAANRANMSGRKVNDYAFTYTRDRLPGKAANDLKVVVEVDPGDGSDRIADKKQAAELDAVFEQVAQARLAAPAPKP